MSLKLSLEQFCRGNLPGTPMDAVDVLRNMVSLYAAFDSYRDTGFVTATISKSGVVHRTAFSTLYKQPSLFRFTFFRPHPHPPLAHIMTEHAAGFDGIEGYILRKRPEDLRAVRTVTSLELAIAGATGISSGSAHTIGRLLLPNVEGLSVLGLINPRFNPDLDIEGIVCYSITAQLPKAGERELWIEKDTLLLRKVIGLRQTARSEEVRENIQVNETLESRLFAA
jgi:hypothetical protein